MSCGALLADAGLDVSLVERLPAAGGQEPERETQDAASRLERRGVRFLLGTLAVRFDGGSLITLGVDGEQRMPCDFLVVATGTRPATRGELGITGDRCAGVLPGSAMLHLLEVGLLPGHRPVVYGDGSRAIHCAELLLRGGATVATLVASERPPAELPEGVGLCVPYTVESVRGTDRVTTVSLAHEGGGPPAEVAADALILAAGERPMRNIEGAVQAAPGVVFCQADADGESGLGIARAAAEQVLIALAAASRAPVSPSPVARKGGT